MHVYSTDEDRKAGYAFLAVVAVVLAIVTNAALDALGWGPDWLWGAPTVAAAYGLVYAVVDAYAWRWSVLRALRIVRTPILDGTYEGELLAPPWRPNGQEVVLPIRIRVSQTWSRISIEFEVVSPESSTSFSSTAEVRTVGHADGQLTYTYTNHVRPGVAEPDMNDHDGTARLVVRSDGIASGRYYNFRGRQGTLALHKVSA